jgi:hypothetical protein
MSQDSLFRSPPTPAEQKIIHEFFVKTLDLKVTLISYPVIAFTPVQEERLSSGHLLGERG